MNRPKRLKRPKRPKPRGVDTLSSGGSPSNEELARELARTTKRLDKLAALIEKRARESST